MLLADATDSPMAGWRALLCGIAMATALLLLTRRLWLNVAVCLPLLLFQPVEWYAVHTYHSQVSPAMFAVFLLTNVGEASDFLAHLWPLILGLYAAWIAVLAGVIWSLRRWRSELPLALRLAIAGPLLVAAVASAVAADGPAGIRIHAAAAPFAGSAIRCGQMLFQRGEVERLAAQRAGFSHAAASVREGERQLVILVIGESLRWGNLQINGYGRGTTPRLSARDGVLSLGDVAACSHLTTLALPPALTGCSPDDHDGMLRRTSLVAACREAGFATRWLSNQAPTGRWDELVASYAHEAEAVRWMNPAPLVSEWGRVQVYDDKLVDALAAELVGLPDRALIVLHMQGSHMRYELRYRPEEAVFHPAAPQGAGVDYRQQPELMRNAYDNSVVMTDRIIDTCIDLHLRSGRTGFVMFVADHGESLLDDARGFQGHGCLPPPEVELRVPWLAWPSPAEIAAHPAPWRGLAENRMRKASTRDLFQTLLDLAGVRTRDSDPQRSLASPTYRERARAIIDSWQRPLDFDRDVLGR